MALVERVASVFRHKRTEAFLAGLVATRDATESDVATGVGHSWRGVESEKACHVHEDFFPTAGVTLPAPWGEHDTSAAGAPTTDYVANADNGVFRLKHDATDEAQNIALYFADHLIVESTKQPYFEARVTYTNASPAAAESLVIGLAAARNATLDSNTAHAWFKLTGANNNILVESDDGTTDDDDNDTTIDWVSGTALVLGIDMSELGAIKFYVDGALVATLAASAMTGNLQPYIELQKTGGTTVAQLDVDYVDVDWMR